MNSARSHSFFLRIKDRVAPYDATTGMFRKDFHPHLQALWEIIAGARLTTYSSLPEDSDCPLRIEDIEAGLAKVGLSKVDADRLAAGMKYELEKAEHRPDLFDALLNGSGFKGWLRTVLMKAAVKKLILEIEKGTATAESFRLAGDKVETAAGADTSDRIVMRSIMEAQRYVPEDEIIGPGYFGNRGEIITLVGQSGKGKSTLGIQFSVSLVLGRGAFGLTTRKPRRVLIIQAENSDGDIAWVRDEVIAGLGLSEAEQATVAGHLLVPEPVVLTGDNLVRELKRALAGYGPDLVLVDPALSFVGGDSSLQIDVGHFLRHQIWPLVRAYRCLFLILHHTGKSAKNQKDTADVNYISLGSVEWDNVPRATLVIQETRTPGVFALIATKRYRRLGWVNHDGTVTDRRYIRQSQQPGKIFWEECTADEVRKIAAVQRQGTSGRLPGEREDLILAVIEETGSIKQEDLFQKLKTKHQIGKNRARSLAQHLEAQGDIERNVRDKIVWYEIPRSSGKEGS